MKLLLTNGEFIEMFPGYSESFTGPVLKDATAYTSKTPVADVTIQVIAYEDFTIRLSIGTLLEKVRSFDWIQRIGCYSSFMLKNGMFKEIANAGKIHLRKDQYSCYFTPPAECSALFERHQEFCVLDIFYSTSLINELSRCFPQLTQYVQKSSVAFLTHKTNWIFPKVKEIYTHILESPYSDAAKNFYLNLKVRELLFHLLEKAFVTKSDEFSFTAFEMARIHEARNILEEHIGKKPPTIRSLAKKVALNELKLKRGFRKYFDSGIFEWLINLKMEHAKMLILTTNKPIKEIASIVGYPLTTNFITAFRRRFGYTPGSLRRN